MKRTNSRPLRLTADPLLLAFLERSGIPYRLVDGNGGGAQAEVAYTPQLDAAIVDLVDQLAELRWSRPRLRQLHLPGWEGAGDESA